MNPTAFEEGFMPVPWLPHTNYLLLGVSGDLLSLFPAQLFPKKPPLLSCPLSGCVAEFFFIPSLFSPN